MIQKITKLSNGLRIVTGEMSESHSVAASILVGTGGRYEDFKVNGGVSHFLEHLLFKGTAKRPSAKIISEEIDAVGGYNNAYTSNDLTNYYVKVPKRHGALAIEILADMMTGSLLDPVEIDRERSVIIEEMNVWRDDPSRSVGWLVPPLLWPDNPLGQEILGPEDVINNIPRDAIAAYWRRYYSPDNMVVSVAGKVKHEQVVEQVKELMGKLKAVKPSKFIPIGDVLSTQRVNVLEKDTNQAHFIIAGRSVSARDKKEPAVRILTNILGRGMSSRLFTNVRERKGLAYTVYASNHGYTDTGLFEVYAGVNLDKIEQAIEAVMEELDKITFELVDEGELNKAKNQTRGGSQMAMESNGNVAERFGIQLLLHGNVKSIDDYLEEIDAVTAEDVRQVARELLVPANLRMGIIAPDAKAAQKKFEELTKD